MRESVLQYMYEELSDIYANYHLNRTKVIRLDDQVDCCYENSKMLIGYKLAALLKINDKYVDYKTQYTQDVLKIAEIINTQIEYVENIVQKSWCLETKLEAITFLSTIYDIVNKINFSNQRLPNEASYQNLASVIDAINANIAVNFKDIALPGGRTYYQNDEEIERLAAISYDDEIPF